jgi:hypothetical protein
MGFDAQGTCNFISRAGTISFEAQGGPIIFNNSGVTGASGDMDLTSGNVTTIQSTKQTYIKTTNTTEGDIYIQPATNRNVNIETAGTGDINLTSTDLVTLQATNGIRFNSAPNPNYSYSGLTQTFVGYTATANNSTAVSNGGTWTALINSENILGSGVKVSRGIWQVEFVCGFIYSLASHQRLISISAIGSTSPDASRTIQYSQNTGLNIQYMITSIFVVDNTTTTFFCMGQLPQTGGTVSSSINRLRITRIG